MTIGIIFFSTEVLDGDDVSLCFLFCFVLLFCLFGGWFFSYCFVFDLYGLFFFGFVCFCLLQGVMLRVNSKLT